MGDDADRAALLGAADDVPAPARRRAGRGVPRAGRRQPAAGARLQGSRLAGASSSTPRRSRSPSATTPARTSKRCSTASTGSGSRTRSTRGWCAASTTTRSTTFEFSSQSLDAAQNGIGGGGRYDGLVEQMGGKPTPGIGFGIGIERVLIACAAEGVVPGARADRRRVRRRRHGESDRGHAARHRTTRRRPARGARLRRPFVQGADEGGRPCRARGSRCCSARREAEHGAVGVRDMRSHEQIEVPRELVAGWLQERLETDPRTELDSQR